MSKLPNCERDSLNSFINILRVYGLDQQKESKIGVVQSFRSEIEVLTYQPKQGGHLKIAKKELQELEVDQQNPNSKVVKEDLQQLKY